MLALYRSGRQADALEVYRETRRFLHDELAIEPGPELQALERAILNQAPESGVPRACLCCGDAAAGSLRWPGVSR